jgi:hypothetical protein
LKKSMVCLVLTLAPVPLLAGEAAPVLDRLVDCTDLKSSRDRLACFDQEIAPLARARSSAIPPPVGAIAPRQQAAPPTPSPASAPAISSAPAAPPAATFGSEQLATKRQPSAEEDEIALHARIADLRAGGAGTFVVALDNGQSWRHENSMLGEYLRKGEAITISKGALGTYRLTRDAGAAKNWIRVTRIR